MEDVFILSGVRTPIGKFGGALAGFSAPELGARAIRCAVERAGIEPEAVEGAYLGNVIAAGLGQAPARQAALGAGLPERSWAATVNEVCGSGLLSVMLAAQAIRLGEAEALVAGGMESMSNAPYTLPRERASRLGDLALRDSLLADGLWCAFEDVHMGTEAEYIARKWEVGRAEQDEYAVRSQERANASTANGGFAREIVPVEVRRNGAVEVIERDEGPRPDTSLERLARLKPAFEPEGSVTAGNASQISDGAAALVLAGAGFVQRHGLTPLARITGSANVGVEPKWVFDGPVHSMGKLMQCTGARIEDYDLIEVNEAFAAQVLANGRGLGWDWERVNVKGGSIALGHPLGASGARVLVTLLHALVDRDLHRGAATLCLGGGGSVAMSIERD
jgi:acetyl-CoA C-acetyltransferase